MTTLEAFTVVDAAKIGDKSVIQTASTMALEVAQMFVRGEMVSSVYRQKHPRSNKERDAQRKEFEEFSNKMAQASILIDDELIRRTKTVPISE